MRLPTAEARSIVTRHQPVERIESGVEGGGVPSANPDAVARAMPVEEENS